MLVSIEYRELPEADTVYIYKTLLFTRSRDLGDMSVQLLPTYC